jgi:DNA-binding transcriptional LysR family regulator
LRPQLQRRVTPPPAVSQHIAKLETDLSVHLFDRVGGRLALTAAGAALLPIAFEMLDLDARGRATVTEPADVSHIVVAGFASAISSVLIPRLGRLRQHASLEISEAEDVEALRDLGLGAVDIVLTQEYDGTPVERNRRFTYTALGSDRLRLVLPPNMASSTTIEELSDAPWLLNGRTTRCALATTRVLAAAGIAPRVVGTIADNATLLALVSVGQGVTVVPARVIDDGHYDVTIAEQDLGVTRTILAVTRTATTSSVSLLLDLLGPI